MRSVLLFLVLLICAAAPAIASADAGGQLIAFVLDDGSDVSRGFARETLPALRDLAGELGVEFFTIDVSQGAPEDIHCVPAIAFENHRGRAVYQGRYTTLDRVRNFLQTARIMPQGERLLERTMLPVSRRGRMTVGTPIKIGALSGDVPGDFDEEAFHAEMRSAIAAGMETFALADRAEFGRTDRLFYVDFHPHRSCDGMLYLSTALFSQFHCHEPLYTRFDDPWTGTWETRGDVIARAAAELERGIEAAIVEPGAGDGFIALDDVPIVRWSSLGLPTPVRPQSGGSEAVDLEVPTAWRVDTAAQSERAPVLFRFPAPLDSYTGRATALTGEITFDGDRIESMSGTLTVPVRTVTMGEPDLDAHLQSGAMLASGEHPDARFVLESAGTEPGLTLQFGALVPVRLRGSFSMKGVTIPLQVPAQLELTIADDDRPRLMLQGTWSVDLLGHYGLEGPDGPEDIRHTLLYTCDIVLVSKD